MNQKKKSYLRHNESAIIIEAERHTRSIFKIVGTRGHSKRGDDAHTGCTKSWILSEHNINLHYTMEILFRMCAYETELRELRYLHVAVEEADALAAIQPQPSLRGADGCM